MRCDLCDRETAARVTRLYEGRRVSFCLDCFLAARGGSVAERPAGGAA